MREAPLITFTKADDNPGDTDYIVHGDALTMWLASGPYGVVARRAVLAAGLRAMADHLQNESGPVAVSIDRAYAFKKESDEVDASPVVARSTDSTLSPADAARMAACDAANTTRWAALDAESVASKARNSRHRK